MKTVITLLIGLLLSLTGIVSMTAGINFTISIIVMILSFLYLTFLFINAKERKSKLIVLGITLLHVYFFLNEMDISKFKNWTDIETIALSSNKLIIASISAALCVTSFWAGIAVLIIPLNGKKNKIHSK